MKYWNGVAQTNTDNVEVLDFQASNRAVVHLSAASIKTTRSRNVAVIVPKMNDGTVSSPWTQNHLILMESQVNIIRMIARLQAPHQNRLIAQNIGKIMIHIVRLQPRVVLQNTRHNLIWVGSPL